MGSIGSAWSGKQDSLGNKSSTEIFGGDIRLGLTGDKVDYSLNQVKKEKSKLKKQIDNLLSFFKEMDGQEAYYFLDKPVNEYDEYDKKLADLNPDLLKVSQKIDDARKKIRDLERQEINLGDAQDQMLGALDNAGGKIEQSSDEQLGSIALNKDIQVGAAQGLAGKSGATTGMLSNINSEISNKFAPQSLQVQAQRDSALSNIAAQEVNIPGKLSAINAQNISDKYNKAKTIYQERLNNRTSNTKISNNKTTISNDFIKRLLDRKKNEKTIGAKIVEGE